MGFAQPNKVKVHVLVYNEAEGEGGKERESTRSGRHDLIVAANEFHLLSHSKFIAFVQQERAAEKKQFIIIQPHDLNERGNGLTSTAESVCRGAN